MNIERINRFGEIGFIISEITRALGLATEALKAVISFLFDYMAPKQDAECIFPEIQALKELWKRPV